MELVWLVCGEEVNKGFGAFSTSASQIGKKLMGGDPEAYKEESIRELVGKSRAIVVAMRKELGIEKLG